MNLNLPDDQKTWLEAQVQAGTFPTIEAAAHAAIATAMADYALIDKDDLEWTKPYIDKGRAEAESGNVLTHAEHRARMAARLTALRS